MTISSAFLIEMAAQVRVARLDLSSAEHHGDEAGARVAVARLDELEDILTRATDMALHSVPSLL